MKCVYKLQHKRYIETDSATQEKVFSSLLLGFFSSKSKCKNMIQYYLQKPGFNEYPNDFVFEPVYADADDYNDSVGEFDVFVFYLSHEYYNGKYDIISDLGYYSTRKSAEDSLSRYIIENENKNHPDGFCIDEYKIDNPEWLEGFFTF